MILTMGKFTFILILITSFIFIPLFITTALGQPPPPPPQDIPIDGGLSLLIAAGVAFGAKKIHSAQKEK